MNMIEKWIAYLQREPNATVPASRYGEDSLDCNVIGLRVAQIVAEQTGEPITRESLDHAMSLVVNDHDNPAELLAEYGTASERRKARKWLS